MSRTGKVYLVFIAVYILASIFGLETLRSFAFWGTCFLTIYFAAKLIRKIVRKFLWRIRRKLILSYIFIGFIPLFLLAALFVLAFWIFMGQATSEMFNSSMDSYLLQTKMEGKKLLHLVRILSREEAHREWYEDLSAEDREWLHFANIVYYSENGAEMIQGDDSEPLPDWIRVRNFSGIVMRDSRLWLVSTHHRPQENKSLLIEVPVTGSLLDVIGKKIGANITYVPGGQGVKDEFEETVGKSRNDPVWPTWWDVPVAWVSVPDQHSWKTGEQITLADRIRIDDESDSGSKPMRAEAEKKEKKKPDQDGDLLVFEDDKGHSVTMGAFALITNVSRIYNHIFSRSTTLQKFVYALMFGIAIFFLVIELLSFVSGFLLARSITASVHNLFEGTERIKKGDLNYKIKVNAKDQLGDLAVSFNSMTDSIQNLLIVRAEKERLAEALLIARHMQEKLLPKEITSVGGIDIATMNLPAEEVCGDYYDILRKSDDELGVIIADVSGKGPSAALYMAEVKGVMLSTGQRSISPREIMMEANRILVPTLDSRNFITMTYAMINEKQRIMRMCRAGHNPMLHYSALSGKVEIVNSRGIGLGMGRNGMFDSTLEEVERGLSSGDVLVFYTDGLTEAMNELKQLYGLDRLAQIILKTKDDSTEEIKNAIFQDLDQFLNKQLPQDDVTLVLLKIR